MRSTPHDVILPSRLKIILAWFKTNYSWITFFRGSPWITTLNLLRFSSKAAFRLQKLAGHLDEYYFSQLRSSTLCNLSKIHLTGLKTPTNQPNNGKGYSLSLVFSKALFIIISLPLQKGTILWFSLYLFSGDTTARRE